MASQWDGTWNLFLSGFETHIDPNNGAVAEWHVGGGLQTHTHWFESSPRLETRLLLIHRGPYDVSVCIELENADIAQ